MQPNSLRNLVDVRYYVNESILKKNKVLVLVEGMDDVRFFVHFFDVGSCDIRPANGKTKVVDMLSSQHKTDKMLGIVDRDFDGILEKRSKKDNLFYVDFHDVEMMILETGKPARVFGELLAQFGSEEIGKLSGDWKEMAYQMAYPVGCLRLLNELEDLRIRFDAIPWNDFVQVKQQPTPEVIVSLEVLATRCWTRFMQRDEMLYRLKTYIQEHKENRAEICCGHDMAKAIAFLARIFKQTGEKQWEIEEDVEQLLRVSYHAEDFKKTMLYKNLQEWELKKQQRILI